MTHHDTHNAARTDAAQTDAAPTDATRTDAARTDAARTDTAWYLTYHSMVLVVLDRNRR